MKKKIKILILGCGGFIGSHLSKALVKEKNVILYGLDLDKSNILDIEKCKNFVFKIGDANKNQKWIKEKIKICDIVIPLIAIATPNTYITDPLKVFELDFELNLKIIKLVVKFKKRLIFPSTSEVYGMSKDKSFKEYSTKLIVGPVHKSRWIYSISKQLLDRVIFAYGKKDYLKFTIFRPFNWIGPNLDSLEKAQMGNGRVLSIFMSNIINKKGLKLVNSGKQKRSFTYIDDGISALKKIILGNKKKLNYKIINIGNPKNHITIKKLSLLVIKEFIMNSKKIKKINVSNVSEKTFFGDGYEDMEARKPNIDQAKKLLKWKPKVDYKKSIKLIVKYYIDKYEG